MKKKILSIVLSMAVVLGFMPAINCSYAGDSATINSGDSFLSVMNSYTNYTIKLDSDITVNGDIDIPEYTSKDIDLNGHTLTMNGTISCTQDHSSVAFSDETYSDGAIVAGADNLFIIEATDYEAIAMKNCTVYSNENSNTLINASGTGYSNTTPCVRLSNADFIASGNCTILNLGQYAYALIQGGSFESESGSCIYGVNNVRTTIGYGSFFSRYANAIYLLDSSNSTIASPFKCYLNSQEYENNDISFNTMGTNTVVQIGSNDDAFTEICLMTVDAAGNKFEEGGYAGALSGVTGLAGTRVFFQAAAYPGYIFSGWTKDTSTMNIISTDPFFAVSVPDSPRMDIYAVFMFDFDNAKISLDKTSYTYDGTAKKPSAVIPELTKGVDYEISYSNNVKAGTATVTATGCGIYEGHSISRTFTINPASISGKTAALSYTKATYSGNAKKPSVKVTGLASTDYSVAYSNNTKVGKATVTISGKGNYKGTITKSFTISPKKAAIKSVTAGIKKMTVKAAAKPSSTGLSKYQLADRVKGSPSWKYTTTILQSKTVKPLKKGKKYQVKIRAYASSSNCGPWSSIVTTKTIK